MNSRRLYRCRHDRVLAGVASGMAEYLDIDPTVVRVLWVLSVFLGGFSILIYILLAFIMPLEPLTPGEGAYATGTPAGEAGEAGAAGMTGGATAAPGAIPGWHAPDAPAGTTAGWHAAAVARPHEHRDGRGGLFLGVLLVVFGSIAMANVLLPGWAVAGILWPGFLVALGVALVAVGMTRRNALDR